MTSTVSGPEAPGWREAAGRAGHRFLEDKLRIPGPSFPVLRRRRVSALLEEATRHRVTLISAPAGAGKTVACASWAAARAVGRVVWLTLDASDRRDWFWAYVCAGINRARPAPADVLRTLEDSTPESFPLRLVEVAQAFTHPVTLVLDDLHEVTDTAVLSGLDVLIRHTPPSLRVVLSARRPPPLQLARLRVAGELADIGGPDLACTAPEADAYFAMMGIKVSAAERDDVLERTQGWMAGLRLAAMRADAGQGLGGSVTGLVGDEPIVTDYLWDEVLARQAPEIRALLLRTSIVPEVSGDLADTLGGAPGAARTLERLSRENSFVEALDREHGEYRYHPLLREVLVAEAVRQMPEEIPGLLHRAARWYADHDRVLESVRCAGRGQDWGYAAQVLADSGVAAVMPAGPEELESVLAAFPADRAADDVAVAAAWAMARLWSGDPAGTAAYLDSARRALERSGPATRHVMEPTLAALRILHAAACDSPDPGPVRRGWEIAARMQPSVASQAGHRALGLLWFALGAAGLRDWDVGGARDALRHADRELRDGGLPELRAATRAWRALAEACCGDLTAAQRAADDVRRNRMPVTREASCLATLAYAQVSLARDDLAGAQRLLEEVDSCPSGCVPGQPPVATVAALMRARIMFADGDAAGGLVVLSRLRGSRGPGRGPLARAVTMMEAEVALRSGDTGRSRALLLLAGADDGTAVRSDVMLVSAGLLLSDGDFAAALETVAPFLRETVAGTTQERVRGLLIAAAAQRRLGKPAQAADLVDRALALAEPDGAYRVFLDGGAAVRSAVTVLVPPTSRHAGFAGRVLERFDAQAMRLTPAGPPAGVQLTESERAVLCFLPSHMTNEEISQALYLSVNTVKTHLRSAYRKLGVGSRREAIARGRRMGLL